MVVDTGINRRNYNSSQLEITNEGLVVSGGYQRAKTLIKIATDISIDVAIKNLSYYKCKK